MALFSVWTPKYTQKAVKKSGKVVRCMSDSYKNDVALGEYVTIVAEEDGVNIIGLKRGQDTKFHHTEKLDKGEVFLCQFTENTSAIKIRGKAKVHTKMGVIQAG